MDLSFFSNAAVKVSIPAVDLLNRFVDFVDDDVDEDDLTWIIFFLPGVFMIEEKEEEEEDTDALLLVSSSKVVVLGILFVSLDDTMDK